MSHDPERFDDDIRRAVRSRLQPPARGFEDRLLAAVRLAAPAPRRRGHARLATFASMALAGLLAVTLVVALLAAGHRLPVPPAVKGAVPGAGGAPLSRPTAPTAPTPALPAEDLAAAHLENVAGLVQPFAVTAGSGGQTVELIGVYADAARTVFLVHGLAGGVGATFAVSDRQGPVNASSSSGPAGAGDGFFVLDTGLRRGPDGRDEVTLDLRAHPIQASGAISPTGRWTLQAAVRVGGATALAAPARVVAGGWTWQLATIQETPNVIQVVAIVQGATVDEVLGSGSGQSLALAGPGGAPAPVLAEGAEITVPKAEINATNLRNTEVDATWLRGADGTYLLTIQSPAVTRTIELAVR
jgi:hypothetical protein